MKKTLLSCLLLLSLAVTASAQIVKGDMNDDGALDISDVVSSVNVILGNQPMSYISASEILDPYMVDNSKVVGTWYNKTSPEVLTFGEDGTTDYAGVTTYKFLPYQGKLLLFNASGSLTKILNIAYLSADLLYLDNLTLYTKASYGRETDLAIVNPFFAADGIKGNGNQVKPTGWLDSSYDYENGGTNNGNPRFAKNTEFENGTCFQVWRGYTAYPKNKACQTISVENKGLYIYQAQAYAGNEGKNSRAEDDKMIVMVDRLDENGNVVTIQGRDSMEVGTDDVGNPIYEYFFGDVAVQDTTYVTGVCLVFGDEYAEALDTIHVHSDYPDLYMPKTYRMEYVNTQGAMSLKFGLDAIGNLGCNLYGFGGNHLYYCGDAEKYYNDRANGIEAKPVDMLQQASKGVFNLLGVKVADKLEANLPKGIYNFGNHRYIVK